MYQIVAAQKKYSEDEVRERLTSVYPEWDIENMELSDRGWLVRLKKNAEFPFDEDKKDDSKDDSSDAPKDSEDSDDDSKPKDSEEKDDSDDSDADKIDASDGLDEGEAKDLVGQLNELQGQLNKLVEELGGKAQEVAEDAKAKDDKIKEIADSVKEVAPPEGDMAGLDDLGMDPAMMGADGPPKPPMPPKRPGVPSATPRKRPPVPGGGINTFTKRKTEIVTHPGTDSTGTKISLVAAVRELEAVDEWKNYEIMSMTQNVDGSFSAKLRLK